MDNKRNKNYTITEILNLEEVPEHKKDARIEELSKLTFHALCTLRHTLKNKPPEPSGIEPLSHRTNQLI